MGIRFGYYRIWIQYLDIDIQAILLNRHSPCPMYYKNRTNNLIQFNCKHACCNNCLHLIKNTNINTVLTRPECRSTIDNKIIEDNCSVGSGSILYNSEHIEDDILL